jgi:hypothetical protein
MLAGSADALLYDPETIRIRARELGYGEKNERFIRIVGLPSVRNRKIHPGTVKIAERPPYIPDFNLRITAIFAGLAVFFLLFVPDVLKKKPSPN